MELPLERIFETMLVGVVATLCVLSFLFFFFGHVFRVYLIRRPLQFLLYEPGRALDDAVDDDSIQGKEKPSLFVVLMLAAGLYGLGVITESTSDAITSVRVPGAPEMMSDPKIKVDAFNTVTHGQVASGTADPALTRFLSDYDACAASVPTNSDQSAVCRIVRDRADELYYNAKNLVYQHETYEKELSNLQSRINFARSISQALGFLTLELVIVFLFALIAEATFRYLLPRLRSSAVVTVIPLWARDLAAHWRNLDAIRCLLIAIALMCATLTSQRAWFDCERQFDRRVFGYFYSLRGQNREFFPRSPYEVMTAAKGTRLEPSAVAALSSPGKLLVANDKGEGQPFMVFDLAEPNPEKRLTVLQGGPFLVDEVHHIEKVESLHIDHQAELDHVLAASNLDTRYGAPAGVLSFTLPRGDGDSDSPLRAQGITFTPFAVAPCSELEGAADGCVIEGMARDAEGGLLLGIRYVRAGDRLTSIIAVVHMEQQGAAWGAPRQVLTAERVDDGCSGLSGISALETLRDRSLLVLTSVELSAGQHCSEPETTRDEIAQVRGALWHVPEAKGGYVWPAGPIERFAHKPEGVAELDDGSLLVVFDDDAARKSLARAPHTFALEQNEAAYVVLPASTLDRER